MEEKYENSRLIINADIKPFIEEAEASANIIIFATDFFSNRVGSFFAGEEE